MRPPSVDSLARSIADTGLPQPLLVDAARAAIADGDPDRARELAEDIARSLLVRVVNATGVLLHTNLGRAPLAAAPGRGGHEPRARPRHRRAWLPAGSHSGRLLARLCGAEAALVVNNNAAAVLLVLAALARGREVLVSRGESVEIGGGFRVPEVMEQSGARLVDVGTTNRTRLADYERALARAGADVALVLKVHPSNYRVEGFIEAVGVQPARHSGRAGRRRHRLRADRRGLPVAARTGPPPWLVGEPAARQTLAAGAALVTFSGDKLLGGPQAGVIAGRADLVAACAAHPLARALRPGGLVLGALQDVALAYLRRDGHAVPFWRMATTPADELRRRASVVAARHSRRGGRSRPRRCRERGRCRVAPSRRSGSCCPATTWTVSVASRRRSSPGSATATPCSTCAPSTPATTTTCVARSARWPQAERGAPCTSSPPPATSTTASRRSSWR